MKRSLGAKPLVFVTPTWVIGSYDKGGKPNAATVAWGGICCSKPPLMSISLRKETFSYHNIMQRKAFTINVPSERYAKEADYFGMVSGATVDKLAKTGLTPVASDKVDAPYVQEFPLVVECKVFQVVELGLHTQFIGEVVDVKAEENMLDDKGVPDVERLQPFLFDPEARTYHGVGKFLGPAFSLGKSLS